MKYFKYIGLSLLLFSSFFGMGQTDVSGVISANTTWTLAGSPYNVTGNIQVNSGVKLIIEPGVTVNVANSKKISIEGTIEAIGTRLDSI